MKAHRSSLGRSGLIVLAAAGPACSGAPDSGTGSDGRKLEARGAGPLAMPDGGAIERVVFTEDEAYLVYDGRVHRAREDDVAPLSRPDGSWIYDVVVTATGELVACSALGDDAFTARFDDGTWTLTGHGSFAVSFEGEDDICESTACWGGLVGCSVAFGRDGDLLAAFRTERGIDDGSDFDVTLVRESDEERLGPYEVDPMDETVALAWNGRLSLLRRSFHGVRRDGEGATDDEEADHLLYRSDGFIGGDEPLLTTWTVAWHQGEVAALVWAERIDTTTRVLSRTLADGELGPHEELFAFEGTLRDMLAAVTSRGGLVVATTERANDNQEETMNLRMGGQVSRIAERPLGGTSQEIGLVALHVDADDTIHLVTGYHEGTRYVTYGLK